MNDRMVYENELLLKIGAECLNENITLEEALRFKDIVKQTPTAKETYYGKKGFGKNLKRICVENGIRMTEISKGADIPVQTLYAITKRSSQSASIKTKTKVFNYLKTRIPELTTEELFTTETKENEQC